MDAAKAQLEAAVSGLKEISFPVIPTRPSKPSVTEPETDGFSCPTATGIPWSDGTALTGWQKVDSSWYYLDENGIMLTGWQKVDGSWYYLTESGAMAANSWVL